MAALAPRVGTPASSTFSGRSVRVRGRRGRSSVGRAPQSHCGGQGFKSPRLHQRNFRPAPPSARSGIACCARRKRDQQTRHLQVHGRPELDKITTALRTACPAHRALASRPAAASAALAVVRAPAADNGKAFSGPRRPWQDEWAAPPSRRGCIMRFRLHVFFKTLEVCAISHLLDQPGREAVYL
jgi:hypothetical protein